MSESDWVDVDSSDPWVDVEPSGPSSGYRNLQGGLLSLLDAMSMGTAQHLAAKGTEFLTQWAPNPQTYDDVLNEFRGSKEQFSGDHPVADLGLKIAGSLPLAMAAPESIPGQMATFGGMSALEQALTSKPDDKMINALIGGGIGAAAPLASWGLTAGGKALAQTELAQRGLDALADLPGIRKPLGEVGAITLGGADDAAKAPSAGEQYLMQRMRTVSPEKLESGMQSLQSAIGDNSPMFLPEAVQSPNIANLAKYLGQYEPSTDIMRGAVDARKAGTYGRVSEILDEVSPQRSVYEGGNQLYGAVQNKVNDLIQARKDAAEVLFSDARAATPRFESSEVKNVLKEPKLQKVINEVRRDFPEFEKLPDNAYRVLDEARQKLWALKEKALANDEPSLARSYNEIRVKLRDAMGKENGIYKNALSIFSEESKPLNEFVDKSAAAILNTPKQYAHTAGSTLASMQPEEITSLSGLIGNDDALRAGFRSGLQSKLDSGDSGRNLASKIVDVPGVRQRLVAALGGDDAAESVLNRLERENLYGDYNNLYASGSPTARYLNEQRMLEGGLAGDVLSKGVWGTARDAANKLLGKMIREYRGSDEMAREIASLMTDPNASADFLERMMPIIKAMSERYQTTGRAFDAARPAVTTTLTAPVKSR